MNRLQTLVNPELNYTINDLFDLCIKAGYNFELSKITSAVSQGRLESHQIGGKGTDRYILGRDALKYFFK